MPASDTWRARSARRMTILATMVVLTMAAGLTVGCAGKTAQTGTAPQATSAAPAQSGTAGTVTTAADVQTCAECGGKGMPPKVVGTPAVAQGVQLITVSLVGGYYSPNTFTAQAGVPIQVVFTGKAKGCLAKPTFKSLGKKADLTGTGTAMIDLGALKSGTYKFTCAMGMDAGTITVK
jgi:hypothetical protein